MFFSEETKPNNNNNNNNGLYWSLTYRNDNTVYSEQAVTQDSILVNITTYLYSALFEAYKALRHGSHSFTRKLHHACLLFVSVHQMASPHKANIHQEQNKRQETKVSFGLLLWPSAWKP